MQNRLKKLRLEKRLTLADVQAKTNIDFKILENFEKGLENGIPNSLAIWQKLANFLEVPIEYLMGLNDEPWFVGKDLTDILGYSNSRKALKDHVDKEDQQILKSRNVTLENIPNRGLTAVNESGMYSC